MTRPLSRLQVGDSASIQLVQPTEGGSPLFEEVGTIDISWENGRLAVEVSRWDESRTGPVVVTTH